MIMNKLVTKNFWKGPNLNNFFEVNNELRTYLAHPYLASIINNNNEALVLDYGCGKGELLKHISPKFNGELHCYDPNTNIIDEAISKCPNDINVKFFSNIENLNIQYDIIILSFVLITIDNREECLEILKNCKSLLKENGRVLILETHPNYRTKVFSTYQTNMKSELYFEEYMPIRVVLNDAKNNEHFITFYDYHKSLTELSNLIFESRFVIEKIHELKDTYPKNSDKETVSRLNSNSPPYIYIQIKNR